MPYNPLCVWLLEETESRLDEIKSILGPAAIQRHGTIKIDPGKPLANGLGSTAIISGGWMMYESHETSNLQLAAAFAKLKGMRNGVRGQEILRTSDGLIEVKVELAPAFGAFDELNRFLGFVPLVFKCADAMLSTDELHPSILQNLLTVDIKRGTPIPNSPLFPGGTVPIDCRVTYDNRVAAYVHQSKLVGIFDAEFEFQLVNGTAIQKQEVRAFGDFELVLS